MPPTFFPKMDSEIMASKTRNDKMDIQEDNLTKVRNEEDDYVKLEDSGVDSDSLDADIVEDCKKPRIAVHSTIEDISTALISPGFSTEVLSDKKKRDKICQSIDVKHRQEDIIQSRLQTSPFYYANQAQQQQYQRQLPRRMPRKLSLDYSPSQHLSPRTAPLHGGFTMAMTPIHGRMHRHSRVVPYEHAPYVSSPNRRQSFVQTPRQGVPQSVEMRRSSATLPSVVSATRQPITPPSERGEKGLDTLSRAARLKVMKEEYLAACGDSFDALHGITA